MLKNSIFLKQSSDSVVDSFTLGFTVLWIPQRQESRYLAPGVSVRDQGKVVGIGLYSHLGSKEHQLLLKPWDFNQEGLPLK